MALYFKINLLHRIRELNPNNKEVEVLLNKWLELNWRAIKRDISEGVPENPIQYNRNAYIMNSAP